MAVLNKIRQRSLFLIVIIALALFSFVLADFFRNSDAFSEKSRHIVGSINGKEINRDEFLQRVEATQRQLGPNASNGQVMNRVWEDEVKTAVMETQYEKLGLSVEKNQMRSLIKKGLSNTKDFLNEAGVFDENKLNEFIANLKEISPQPALLGGRPITYRDWVNYEQALSKSALEQNYLNLVKAGLTATVEDAKTTYKMANDKINIKYVRIPYTSIPDKDVTVSKSDIASYIKAHESQYKVEASRDIRYVEFKETPTMADETAIKTSLNTYLNGQVVDETGRKDTIVAFSKVKDNAEYINIIAGSSVKFDDRFVFKSSLPKPFADSIANLKVGGVFGPYKFSNSYRITKLIAEKQLPDSAKVRHILIPYLGLRTSDASIKQTEEQAKATADSLLNILKKDRSKFGDFVNKFSKDRPSIGRGGIYDWHPYHSMVKAFNDFEFEGKTGDLGVVKTPFGFHIIEILGQTAKKRALKIGTIAKTIEPSEATLNKVFRDASTFEVDVAKNDFQEVAKKSKYLVRPINGIKVLDENISGLGRQRSIVRWAFNDETAVGSIKRFTITGGYAIIQLVAKHEAGLMPVEMASATVLSIIRNERKATLIKQRATATDLKALAAAEKTTVKTASAITSKLPMIAGVGKEPLVIGTAFGMALGKTSKLITGTKGVYMVQVTKKTPATPIENYQVITNQIQQKNIASISKVYNSLKEAADIEDNRAKNQIQ